MLDSAMRSRVHVTFRKRRHGKRELNKASRFSRQVPEEVLHPPKQGRGCPGSWPQRRCKGHMPVQTTRCCGWLLQARYGSCGTCRAMATVPLPGHVQHRPNSLGEDGLTSANLVESQAPSKCQMWEHLENPIVNCGRLRPFHSR